MLSLIRGRSAITTSIHKATKAQRRWRAVTVVTGGSLIVFAASVLTSGCGCPFVLLHAHAHSECAPLAELGAEMAQRLVVPPGVAVLLLGVLPTDAAAISASCTIGSTFCFTIVGLSASALVSARGHDATRPPQPHAVDGDAHDALNGSEIDPVASRLTIAFVGALFLYAGCSLAATRLSRATAPRQRLLSLWSTFRLVTFVVGAAVALFHISRLGAPPEASHVTSGVLPPAHAPPPTSPIDARVALMLRLLSAASPLLTAALFSPGARARLTRRIRWGRLLAQASDSEPPEATAAAIAALVGDKSPREAFETARGRFCAIRYSQIDQVFWSRRASAAESSASSSTSSPASASHDGSAARPPARRLAVESVDISTAHVPVSFISHSWSDCAFDKHARLSQWAAQRQAANGEQPLVWIDKACIDQKCIEQDLACLPIYLAVCERLVVVAGCTYPQRLWCALELFVFLHVTEQPGRLSVLPVGGGDVTQACAHFDAARALCYRPSDRERLLAVVEAGFGRVSTFNTMVRQMFALHLAPRGGVDEVTIDMASETSVVPPPGGAL